MSILIIKIISDARLVCVNKGTVTILGDGIISLFFLNQDKMVILNAKIILPNSVLFVQGTMTILDSEMICLAKF